MSGAWDCHAHIIEPGYPLAPTRGYEPPVAPLADYLAFIDRNRIAHGVLVQPSVYGFDNRCLLDGLTRAEGRLRGIVVPPPTASASDLAAMQRKGVRGVRCNLINPGGLAVETVMRWQPVLRDLGWHVELHVAIESVADLHALIEQVGVPVVIDHMGRPAPGRTDPSLRPQLQQLIDLVRAGHCWVKVSGHYRLSAMAPPWRDVAPLAQALVSANAQHCLWGSDWPHPDTQSAVREEDLFVALAEMTPDKLARETMMSAAPRALFSG